MSLASEVSGRLEGSASGCGCQGGAANQARIQVLDCFPLVEAAGEYLCRASRIMAEVTSRTSTRNRAKLKLGQAC